MMLKIQKIEQIENFKIFLRFSNQELRLLNFEALVFEYPNSVYAKKIEDNSLFSKVKIGELGQIYWDDVAEMKDLDGNTIACEFDMSPEFVYHNSEKVE